MIPEDKIKQFKAALLYEMLPRLIREGGTGISLPKLYPQDDAGNFEVPVRKVIDFFLDEVRAAGILSETEFLNALHTLFTVFSEDMNNVVFTPEEPVSEERLLTTDNRSRVELLTTNLIISFFNNIRSYDGTLNPAVVDEDLKTLIRIANSGRENKKLLEITLETLIAGLKEEGKWVERLQQLTDAGLVCRLVGEQLPKIETSVLSGMFQQVRGELGGQISLIQKIRRTKDHLAEGTADQKKYIKAAVKLDQTHEKLLARVNDTLGRVQRFARFLKVDTGRLVGEQEALLNENLALIFFGDTKEEPPSEAASAPKSYVMARAAMDRLHQYPELAFFCRRFRDLPEYQPLVLSIQQQYFQKLNRFMAAAVASPREEKIKGVEHCLWDWQRMISNIGLEKEPFKAEAAMLQKRYLHLIHKVPVEMLSPVISFSPGIREIIGIPEYEFNETVRNALLTACFESLMALQPVPGRIDEFKKELKRILACYADHFSPRRFFYQNFFETCVGMIDLPTTELFNTLTQTHKLLARELALLFSEPDHIGQFLNEDHRRHARTIFEGLRE